ncbi:6-pyruvoyl trahydropterin synthase family protein [Rubrobacter aplysinae]|uniref:6-pyruvoyl trahydropterin synthase family protein n=1 Tax=Rubrobacter aplysinae TaxID=909625 RepID=UPI00064B8F7D|nr:6-carboxytetrahydropterin synthase [Rubrobacter aplysinae]
MYRITKQFSFSASHRLDHLPEGHPCARIHGHNYVVEVVLESAELNADGFVRDYGELSPLKHFIDERLDHRHLDDVLPGGTVSSAENVARFLYEFAADRWPEVAAVRVSETPKTWAEYRPGGAGN